MSQLMSALARILPPKQVISDPLRRLAYGTDASFYRLTPEVVAVVESEEEVQALLQATRALGKPGDLSRSRHQPVGPGRHRQRAGTDWRGLCHLRDWPRRRHGARRPRHHWRRGELPAGAARAQDRPRSGLDQRLQDRRHCRQQRLGHVLRHGAKQLPHAGRHARGAGGRHRARHRRPGQRGQLSPEPRQPGE